MGRGDLGTLVRICDPGGRPRGTGFVADDRGTVVTSHEAVEGLVRIMLRAPGEPDRVADTLTLLPETGLALVRAEGLGIRPLPVSSRTEVESGMYVSIAAHGWREARVLGTAPVSYATAGRRHPLLRAAWELAIGTEGAEALRLGGQATGGPVVDPETGAVLGVLGTALHGDHRAAGYALPLVPVGPLAELLSRNASSAPCYGRDLNLAGVLELAATSTGAAWTAGPPPVERAHLVREFASFAASDALVLAVVGVPGSGRTTALAAHCAERASGDEPAATIWLRGADLRPDDTSVADAVGRVLRQAGRIVGASGVRGDTSTATPERAALLARESGRELLVVLDGPEEMPPALAHRLADWTTGTESWLRGHDTRLMLGCRPEHWEQALRLYSPGTLHAPRTAGRVDLGVADPPGGLSAVPAGADAGGPPVVPGGVWVGELTEDEAVLARARYGLAASDLAAEDARHPLVLRLLAEVREAVPGGAPGRPGREEVFGAYLDLMCLRVAVRIAAGTRPVPRGTDVRRLAARVAGRVHEAARRCLGPGQGELDRGSFEEVFPWRTGWASAVLTEGLVVPAGSGYRFGHEELADWIQGAHLDVDGALHALVRRRGEDDAAIRLPARPGSPHAAVERHPLPVPRHRIGPVVQALLLMDREHGPEVLGRRLTGLVEAVAAAAADASWWASRLLAQTLPRLPDPRPYLPTLHHLADHLGTLPTPRPPRASAPPVPRGEPPAPASVPGAVLPPRAPGSVPGAALPPGFVPRPSSGYGPGPRAPEASAPPARPGSVPAVAAFPPGVLPAVSSGGGAGTTGSAARPQPGAPPDGRPDGPEGAAPVPSALFGPDFWAALRVGEDELVDLLRRLVPADPPPGSHAAPRVLDVVAARLVAEPRGVQPLLCRWFGDGRALAAAPHATVGTAAQALLHTHRRLAVDDLCEALVATAHPLAEGLLVALTEDEPAAVCRAVDRWAHDDGRPARRAAAATYGGLVAPHVTTGPDRELLRYAALALLARPADAPLHGPALGLLVRDPHTRARHLPRALTDPRVPATALTTAIATHPEPVLAALQARLHGSGEAAGETLRALAEVTTPALARRAAALVGGYVDRHPDGVHHAAAFIDRRLEEGPVARAVLFPLVAALIRGRSSQVRRGLVPVLAAPGTGASRLLRTELLDVLLDHERYVSHDLDVLDALLRAAALDCARRPEVRTRALVHRAGLLLVRTPDGATRLDRRLVQLAREVPAFAAQLAGWLAAAPDDWAVVVGPSTRRTVQRLGSSMPMRGDGPGHGSLRPA
ncbi:serine protease [Streptomyces sp. P9(2023)]|uniref:trypsin-like peptidase domain-containing protein n=1 Tax=Streptomyces sp. P9(2023) TaxID=3064394 RepID=UPI0028F4093D|nr:trypsin-like peptidase domain-containing protein [Streptomyces sp. P9(2023)]MDT9690989.1 serine protease [Streptomyces sp. P9(2023)]